METVRARPTFDGTEQNKLIGLCKYCALILVSLNLRVTPGGGGGT